MLQDRAWWGAQGSGQAGSVAAGAQLPPAPPEPADTPPVGALGLPGEGHQGLAVSFQFWGSDLSSGIIPAFPCHLAPGLDLVFNNLCLGSSTVLCKRFLSFSFSFFFFSFFF